MSVEKEYAVVKFISDGKYSTCNRKIKTADSDPFSVGNEVSIQWTKTSVFKGTVLFTDGMHTSCTNFH